MSNSGAIRAGKAYVEIYGDDNPLQRTLNKASGKLKSWGEGITSMGAKFFAAGAAIKATLGGAIAVFEETGSKLHDMSLRTGASVEALSTLGFAAEQNGVELEGLEAVLRKMQKTIGGAAEGSAEAGEALAKIGMSFESLKGLKPEDQFRKIMGGLSQIKDPTMRAAEAMNVFGKSGTSILPMLEDGAKGLAEMEEQARSLGLEWSGADAAAADKLGDAMGAMWAVIKKGTANVGAALADDLTGLVVTATELIATTSKWIAENRGLVTIISTVAGGIMSAGAAIVVMGTVLSAAGTVFTVVAGTIGAFWAVVQAVFVGVGAVVGAIIAPVATVLAIFSAMGSALAFLVSPAALTVAALVGIGVAIYKFTNIGELMTVKLKQAFEFLSSKFAELKEDAEKAFKGISDAMSVGDFKLAAEILWLSIQAEWIKGVNFIKDIWRSFSVKVIDIGISIGEGIAGPLLDAFAIISKAWLDVEALMVKGAARAALALKGITDPIIVGAVMGGIDAATAQRKGNADADAANAKAAIPALAGAARIANAGAAGADANADQQRLADALAARDDAIALAAQNKKDAEEGKHNHGDVTEAAAGAKHGPIAGVDVKSTEGFKDVLNAVNGARDNAPAVQTAANTKKMAVSHWRVAKDTHDILTHWRAVGKVGLK